MIDRKTRQPNSLALSPWRLRITLAAIFLLLLVVTSRLFFWQIIKHDQLLAEASAQYLRTIKSTGLRGSIYTADGYQLVSNEEVYRLFVEPVLLTQSPSALVNQLYPTLLPEMKLYREATESAQKEEIEQKLKETLEQRLNKPDAKWISLFHPLSFQGKSAIEQLDITGLGFEPYYQRMYPEASMAAQLTGFVGRNDEGAEVGYFGIEGALDKELRGRSERLSRETDAFGRRLLGSEGQTDSSTDGRDVVLTIRRDVQFTVEELLKEGIERYGAKTGEVIVMEPSTGKILGMASYPSYDQKNFSEYEPQNYKNASVADGYEPGSTFKTLTVAAGIDAGVVEEETQCPDCDGPRVIGKYTLKTWNDQYTPNITVQEALSKSDNTAMIFIAEKLGAEKFQEYLKKFGIGQPTEIELQEDTSPPFPSKWGPVELATISFGQGISATTLQMVKAVSAIANQGMLVKPTLIEKVINRSNQEEIVIKTEELGQVIKPETAERVTRMMVFAAQHGEAQWTVSKSHEVAGKTGTSQVAEGGKYLEDQTIASFIGFSPPDNPKFVMMVKLVAPQSSPWAAETAAPLWYKIADRLYLLFNMPADIHPLANVE